MAKVVLSEFFAFGRLIPRMAIPEKDDIIIHMLAHFHGQILLKFEAEIC